MTGPATALGVAGACAVCFGAAFAGGTLTRPDTASAPGPAATPVAAGPAPTRIADLAPADGLPALRAVPAKRRAAASAPKRQVRVLAPARTVVTRPVRTVAPVRRVTTPAPRPAPAPAKPVTTARQPSSSSPASTARKPGVSFFDDGG